MQRDQILAMAQDHKPFKELITERLRAQANPAGLTVQNKGDTAIIRIYDEIGFFGVSASDVADALEQIDSDKIEVQINSVGGDAFDGVAIYNALRAHPAHITTRVDSLAASAASVIAQAGDRRVMLSGSQMMIHDAWGLAIGNAEAMRSTADVLDKMSDSIASIYEEASESDGFRVLMQNETWLDPDEAVEAGLADEVVKPSKKTQNQIDPKPRFSDQFEEAVASLEKVVAEAENVMTFRSEQGKPPLSDEVVELRDRAAEALNGLKAEPVSNEKNRLRHIELLESEVQVAASLI